MKKIIATVLLLAMCVSAFAGCAKKDETAKGGDIVLKVAALESAYGTEGWKKVGKAFEEANPGIKVEFTIDKNIEDIISPQMKAGNYPDFIHLGIGREKALTETLIKEEALLDLTDVLNMTVPGESKKVSEKIIKGFTDTMVTNPYKDGKTYLAPMFYSPCGLFFNEKLLKDKGWEVPKTWDEMWALGDKAKKEGIYLFTYPHAGYFDAFMFSLFASIGGPDFYNRAMKYEDGIYESAQAKQAFEIVAKLKDYTEPTTVANGNDQSFKKNQQLVLDNKAIFMPNGNWVVGEMKDAPRADGFKWGFTALPAISEGKDRYSFTFFEQAYIPKKAKNQDAAKKFAAFLYSDKAAKILAGGNPVAVQPIEGISASLTGDDKMFYSIYDSGAKAVMGSFAPTNPVESVSIADDMFKTIDSIMTGKKTVAQWQAAVEKASDALRPNIK